MAEKKQIKKEKVVAVKPKESTIKLVTYTMRATIPTMMYGNIQPEITVTADTIEEAEKVLLSTIEKLFSTYAEEPRDGKKPAFIARKEINVEAPKPEIKLNLPKEETTEISAAFAKVRSVIETAMTDDALTKITDQISKSSRLTGTEKDQLTVMVLTKIKELKA